MFKFMTTFTESKCLGGVSSGHEQIANVRE